MELVRGTSLDHVIQQGLAPESERVAICVQILDALGFAHDNGIIHRDLKPGNVMVTDSGEVRVIDFGFALAFRPVRAADPTPHLFLGGTNRYLAPELPQGLAPTYRSDLFSFGVLAHELFTGGVHPFPRAIETNVPAFGEPEIDERLSAQLKKALSGCLHVDQARRFESARLVQEVMLASPAVGALSLDEDRFSAKCFVCGMERARVSLRPDHRTCGSKECVPTSLLQGLGRPTEESLIVTMLPDWKEEIDWDALPSLNSSEPLDLLARTAGADVVPPPPSRKRHRLARLLPYEHDFLKSTAGLSCGNALCFDAPQVAYASGLEDLKVLDLSTYLWSRTLKDPRSWAVVNLAIEKGVRHLATWTAGNAGLSLARLAQAANRWLPRERRLSVYSVWGPQDDLDEAVQAQLGLAGCTMVATSSTEVFTPDMIAQNVKARSGSLDWRDEAYWGRHRWMGGSGPPNLPSAACSGPSRRGPRSSYSADWYRQPRDRNRAREPRRRCLGHQDYCGWRSARWRQLLGAAQGAAGGRINAEGLRQSGPHAGYA